MCHSSINCHTHLHTIEHRTSHNLFTIHFTNLVLNFRSRRILCIHKAYNEALFARGGSFDFHEHYHNWLPSICTVVFCNTDFSDLQKGPTTRRACVFLQLQISCTIANGNYLLENPFINQSWMKIDYLFLKIDVLCICCKRCAFLFWKTNCDKINSLKDDGKKRFWKLLPYIIKMGYKNAAHMNNYKCNKLL